MPLASSVARSLAALAAAVACIPAIAADPSFSIAHCDFSPPAEFDKYTVRWAGACANGKAEGLGVLRAYHDGQVRQIYFGRFSRGEPSSGVIDHPDGYIAGRFRSGKLVSNGERQEVISAFRDAEAAALAFADQLKSRGNTTSARYYQKKAGQLATQMD